MLCITHHLVLPKTQSNYFELPYLSIGRACTMLTPFLKYLSMDCQETFVSKFGLTDALIGDGEDPAVEEGLED